MKFFKKIRAEFLIAAAIALLISMISSAITYQVVMRKVPKVAVVDLLYLNNEFTVNLARYLADHNVGDERMAEVVKAYLANLETLLKDINQSGNYVLLQKQTVVSEGITDITKDLEKVLFESVMNQKKQGAENEKTQ